MNLWTIYDHPADYPDCFVARRAVVGKYETLMTGDMFVADTLEELRALLPPGLTRMHRFPEDDPKIVEVWI